MTVKLLSKAVNYHLKGQAAKTHCPHGHPYDEDNTVVTQQRGYRKKRNGEPSVNRQCRECNRLRMKAWYDRKGREYFAERRRGF